MNYAQKNEGVITFSKLKDFMLDEYFYKLKWVDKVIPEKTSEALEFGTNFDMFLQERGTGCSHSSFVVMERRVSDPEAEIIKLKEKEKEKEDSLFKSYTEKKEKDLEDIRKKIEELQEIQGKTQVTPLQMQRMEACLSEMQRQKLFDFAGEGSELQKRVEVEYNGITLAGTMDEFYMDRALISDIKTSAGIDTFMGFIDSYKMQLAFYQWIVELKYGIQCDGRLQVVTRTDNPVSRFFYATKDSLLQERERLEAVVSNLILAKKTGSYSFSGVENWFSGNLSSGWSACPHTVQEEYILI